MYNYMYTGVHFKHTEVSIKEKNNSINSLRTFYPLKAKLWHLHSLFLRKELPVHGEREAEQAPGVSGLPLDIVGVQVESREQPTAREKGD